MRKGYPLLYRDGEVIFEENSVGKDIYMIESGEVEISHRIDRDKKRIVLLRGGDFFGEMAPITKTVRSATATAAGDVYLVSFSMEEMLERIQADPEFMLAVLRKLMNRLRATTSALGLGPSAPNTYLSAEALEENSRPAEEPLTDAEEDEGISKESYQKLQKTVSYLEQEIQQKDKEMESLQEQLDKRWWSRRKSGN